MSQPPECRMTEAISYRLKEYEFAKYWNTSMDKVIEVVCRRITHSRAGKAMLVGEIVETAAPENNCRMLTNPRADRDWLDKIRRRERFADFALYIGTHRMGLFHNTYIHQSITQTLHAR